MTPPVRAAVRRVVATTVSKTRGDNLLDRRIDAIEIAVLEAEVQAGEAALIEDQREQFLS